MTHEETTSVNSILDRIERRGGPFVPTATERAAYEQFVRETGKTFLDPLEGDELPDGFDFGLWRAVDRFLQEFPLFRPMPLHQMGKQGNVPLTVKRARWEEQLQQGESAKHERWASTLEEIHAEIEEALRDSSTDDDYEESGSLAVVLAVVAHLRDLSLSRITPTSDSADPMQPGRPFDASHGLCYELEQLGMTTRQVVLVCQTLQRYTGCPLPTDDETTRRRGLEQLDRDRVDAGRAFVNNRRRKNRRSSWLEWKSKIDAWERATKGRREEP